MSRILVVDDEPMIVAAIQAMLECNGFESEPAHDCESAEAMITGEFFPVILADLRMQDDEAGLRLLSTIRRLSPRSRVATITGYADATMVQRLRAHGAALVLQKPVAEDELMAALGEMLASIAGAQEAGDWDDEALYTRTASALRRIATGRYGFPAGDAEELIQEAWVLFLEKREEVRSPRTWLSGTIANLCRREIDRRTRERNRASDFVDAGALPAHDTVLSVRQGLSRLDERSRALCTMIGIEQRSYEDVSRAMQLPLGSIGPLYLRAKERLRSTMN